MNRLRITTLLACLALLAAGLAARDAEAKKKPKVEPAASATTPGTLVLSCTVDGATWEIDEGSFNSVKGTTPQKDPVELPPGTHTIRVTRDGYLPYSEVFDIALGQATELEVDMVLYSGKLRVEATPGPVDVQIDEKPMGQAPITADLSIGDHVVRLSRVGFVEEVRKASVKTGQTTELKVTLVAVAEAQRKARGDPVYKKWWFWSVIGGAVAGVVIPTAVVLTRPGSTAAKANFTFVAP
jgi:hypothetical protein